MPINKHNDRNRKNHFGLGVLRVIWLHQHKKPEIKFCENEMDDNINTN